MATQDRAELLRNAVTFLSDPKSQGASFAQKIQFLEAKGLTPPEIDEAMRQASPRQGVQMQPYQAPYNYSQTYSPFGPPQRSQSLDWRDYFIMAVVSGSFVYGAVTLARKYLMPHLQPPSSTAYEADRDALSAQFDAAESMLKQIQEETAGIKQAVENQKAKVDQTTQDVDAFVKQMRDADERNRDEMREIREEVNSIREMLPKMIEKNKESQSQSLAELQQELKSLKALLLSRGPTIPTSPSPSLPSLVGRPSIPAWQLAPSSPSPGEPSSSMPKVNGLNPSPSSIPQDASTVDGPS